MNDQRFFDLAMKYLAGQCTDAERAELEALMARRPELKRELERLRADARLARGILSLADGSKSDTRGAVVDFLRASSEVPTQLEPPQSAMEDFPGYARERLLTKVRQTLGQSQSTKPERRWRWLLGLSGVAAALVLLAVFSSRSSAPVIEVAFLDTAGAVRGSETNETAVFRRQWEKASVQVFDKSTDVDTWQKNRTGNGRRVAKVVYDRAAGEVRVTLFDAGTTLSKTFAVDREVAATLREADKFIRGQTAR